MIEAGLTKAESIDLTIGKKGFSYELPYETRKQAIEVALKIAGMRDRISILSKGVFEIDPSDYEGLLIGSDILCKLVGSNRFRAHEMTFFRRFPFILCAERDQYPITTDVRDAITNQLQLQVIKTRNGSITGTEIREMLGRGTNIRPHIPTGVWDVIQPHLEVLTKSQKGEMATSHNTTYAATQKR